MKMDDVITHHIEKC